MNKDFLNFIVRKQAYEWLNKNPLRLNNQEKQQFIVNLQSYLENNKNTTISDEVFDFLVQSELIKNEPRESNFLKYLNEKYGRLEGYNILDVGAGRICSLSKAIAEQGSKVTAMDTNIRLKNDALKRSNITIVKKLFECDEYAKSGTGTNIDEINLIVGLEPCDATEHIIRQSLKYEKPFDINLCAAPHDSLNGEAFKSYFEWYEHLTNISGEITITKQDCGFVATNNREL